MLFNTNCPHCQGKIVMSMEMMVPFMSWVLKEEDLAKTKDNVRKQILSIKFKDEKEKEDALAWIDKSDTFISPTEVNEILYKLINKGKTNDTSPESKIK